PGFFKPPPDVTGMPTGDLLRFAGVDELLHGVSFGGVQQPIACRGAFRPRRNQRLGDELPERVYNLIGRLAVVTRDGHRTLQRERSGEDGETSKCDTFALVDQTITPVQRRAERLMPRWCRAPSTPLQLQSPVEQRCDLPQSMDADAHGSKFDRQGNAVKLA